MNYLSTRRVFLPATALLLAGAVYGLFSSCSTDEAPLRQLRAHTKSIKGVAHAESIMAPERYCSECHGLNLSGGAAAEPSCYSCHGKTWLEAAEAASTTRAPADHNVDEQGSLQIYKHHPDRNTPVGSCDACHGSALEGQAELNVPSCMLCHDAVWQ